MYSQWDWNSTPNKVKIGSWWKKTFLDILIVFNPHKGHINRCTVCLPCEATSGLKGKDVLSGCQYPVYSIIEVAQLNLLWVLLNSRWVKRSTRLLGHGEHVWEWGGQERRQTMNLSLLLMHKLHSVTGLHLWNSKIKFQVEDSRNLNQV